MKNRFGFINEIIDIDKDEWPFAILMSLYFFLVTSSFWVLKPLKKGLFIDYYKITGGLNILGQNLLGSQAELLAKVVNMFIAALAVIVFTILVRKYLRQRLTVIITLFFIICYFLFLPLLPQTDISSFSISHDRDLIVWSFYLFGDLFITMMIVTFFAFLNDSVSSTCAKRIYGIVGFGGVAGGVFGSSFTRIFIDRISISAWMLILSLVAVAIIIIALSSGKLASKKNNAETDTALPENNSKPEGNNPAFEGAKLVLSSRYLLSIVAIVGIYEMVSTIMDFQFSATVEHFVTSNTGQFFSTVFTITNVVAIIVQLFLTSLIMRKFGIGIALLVLPIAVLLGSAGFLIAPILLIGSSLNTIDNGFSYSINQSAKEALYVPVSTEEKYKGKAFIDMFVQRFAKALAVGLSLLITLIFKEFSTIRWLSLLTGLLLIIWIYSVKYAGRRYVQIETTCDKD